LNASTAAAVPGPLLARGGSAHVHACGGGRVLKLYLPGVPEAAPRREAQCTNAARRAGAPAPEAFEVITVDGRHGVILERVDGPTLLDALMTQPDQAERVGGTLAALHAQVHALSGDGLPALHDRVARRIAACAALQPAARERVAAIAAALPPGDALCHGDFHPGNVILGERQPVVIDWYDAARGPVEADVARTLLLVAHGDLPGGSSPAIEVVRAALGEAYLRDYRAACTIDAERLDAWTTVVAAARLAEARSATERTRLMRIVARALDRA